MYLQCTIKWAPLPRALYGSETAPHFVSHGNSRVLCVPLDARTVHTTGFDNRWKRARCRGRTSSDDSQRTFRSIRRESKSVLVRCKQSLRTLPFKRRLARCSACQRGHTLFTLWAALGSSGQQFYSRFTSALL